MDKDYIFTINPRIDLSLQKISKETNAILISLFRDYFANESQKKILTELLNKNQEEVEKAKRDKYNPDDIFNKKVKERINIDIKNNELNLMECKESFFSKLTKLIKRLLNLK